MAESLFWGGCHSGACAVAIAVRELGIIECSCAAEHIEHMDHRRTCRAHAFRTDPAFGVDGDHMRRVCQRSGFTRLPLEDGSVGIRCVEAGVRDRRYWIETCFLPGPCFFGKVNSRMPS